MVRCYPHLCVGVLCGWGGVFFLVLHDVVTLRWCEETIVYHWCVNFIRWGKEWPLLGFLFELLQSGSCLFESSECCICPYFMMLYEKRRPGFAFSFLVCCLVETTHAHTHTHITPHFTTPHHTTPHTTLHDTHAQHTHTHTLVQSLTFACFSQYLVQYADESDVFCFRKWCFHAALSWQICYINCNRLVGIITKTEKGVLGFYKPSSVSFSTACPVVVSNLVIVMCVLLWGAWLLSICKPSTVSPAQLSSLGTIVSFLLCCRAGCCAHRHSSACGGPKHYTKPHRRHSLDSLLVKALAFSAEGRSSNKQWLHCQLPGIVGLVGLVLVYWNWVRLQASVSAWRHVQLSRQISPRNTLCLLLRC